MRAYQKSIEKLVLFVFFFSIVASLSAQYKFKIIADNNQIYKSEFGETSRIKCDGIWSIPGNSAGNKGRDIPIIDWETCYTGMQSEFLCTEDYWINFPEKNYDLTKDIVGEDKIDLICLYAEPSKPVDNHETTVVSDHVIQNAYSSYNKKVIVLARSYTSGKWQNNVSRALANSNVAGVCFEQKPDVNKYKNYNLASGIKAVLLAGKKAFLLLPPNFSYVSNNYTADIINVFNYLKTNVPEVLESESLYFVPNCYNRLKDKETTMYGGENSVEGAILKLKELRGDNKDTYVDNSRLNNILVYPNPAETTLFIKGELPLHISLIDINGREVLQAKHAKEINLQGINPGLYVVKIMDAQKRIAYRKVIVK